MRYLILLLGFALSACEHLKYEPDIGFLNSAQANSPELMVKVQGQVCKDLDQDIGLCAKRIRSNETIKFELDPRPYAYRIDVKCTQALDVNFSTDVLEEKPYSFEIKPEKFQSVRSFTCVGEIFPKDRDQDVSAFWNVRFMVIDWQYKEREKMNVIDDGEDSYLVLGSHAKYAQSCSGPDPMVCEFHDEETVLDKGKIRKAWSESEMMRLNYWNY